MTALRAITLTATITAVMLPGAPVSAANGRWVDLGHWNGVTACESAGDAQATNRWSGADGLLQFLPSTWDGIARITKRRHLIGEAPSEHSIAQQVRQAERLRRRYGPSQWVCGWRYGDGTGPQWVTGERPGTANPRRCARNLHRRHGIEPRAAKSICATPGANTE